MPRGRQRVTLPPAGKGLRSDLPYHLIPDGYIVGGSNVIARDNSIIVRPGYSDLSTSGPFANAAVGGIYYKANDTTEKTFAVSLTKVSEWDGSAWTDRTGTDLTGTNDNQARLALFQTSSSSQVVLVNDVDVPRLLVSGANSTTLGGLGTITAAKDVTVSFQRAIMGNVIIGGVRAPSTLMISDKDDPQDWPAVNQVDLSDTADTIVAVRALNNQMFAIYKDYSVWVGTGNPDVYPFTFELKGIIPGPVSPSSVVPANGVHYYIGQDGNAYRFDGQTVAPIGTEIYRTLQADIDFLSAHRCHGVYDKFNGEIWWFYVSADGGHTFPDAGIVYNVFTSAWSSPFRFANDLSASIEWKANTALGWDQLSTYTWDNIANTYASWDTFPKRAQLQNMVLTSTGFAYKMGTNTTDDGNSISAHFTYPTREYTGSGQKIRIDAVETYWKQADASRDVEVILLTTNTLATAGDAAAAQAFDINDETDQHVAEYADTEARFLSVKHAIPEGRGFDEFRGMTLYLYQRSEPTGN